jgi:nitrite reductase (NADH) large subunit
MSRKASLVIVGNGMVGHRLVELLLDRGGGTTYQLTVLVEEPRLAYDRVNLSSLFEGKSPADLALASLDRYRAAGVEVRMGEVAVAIDMAARRLRTRTGEEIPYDRLVLATGSYPFVPPVKGSQGQGCFVYRTIEDLEAIRAYAASSNVGTVIGGGLLGLEAANALSKLGLETHVVEHASRLMPMQVDELGGAILRRRIEGLGVAVHTGMACKEVVSAEGRAAGLLFADGGQLESDLVVFSAGIRPRDELGRGQNGLEIGPRGGFVIDARCRTSQPDIYAVGECASWDGRTYGLVAPGYQMAEVVVNDLLGGEGRLPPAFDMSTKLKLLGVDVASFGDAFALEPGAHTLSIADTATGVYKKLVLSADKRLLLGGILVGDANAYAQLHQICRNKMALPPHPEDLILPGDRPGRKPAGLGVDDLPPAALICSCHNVAKDAICRAITAEQLTAVAGIKSCTRAGTGCGSCVPLLNDLLKAELKRAGIAVSNRLCEHFAFSRQELYHLIRVQGLRTFDDVLARQGTGRGCEICKPAVASILASAFNEYIGKDEHVGLQDTNDRFLANLQRDGTYSVVPRVPGGEITPEQLIALGQVARRHGLYTKITGAQRVDLFGARVDQLPQVWSELIAAGFESGHAYGKALRTVKSCVGSTWCRYGVQDSVTMAITLENRYKGLRSPHKLKGAASGCARECAEAQGKDFGVIATERGYNLYVCGNGGMKPQHGQLLASDLDEATVIRYLDRFLMFYVRTADRLERTATWLNKLEGGIEYLRQVVIEDSLGIAAELERELQHVVDSYQCEWKTTLADPGKLKRFRPFVNSDAVDPSIVHVPLRGQHRAARWSEKADRVKEGI